MNSARRAIRAKATETIRDSDERGSLSRAAEARKMPERTANSHNDIEIVVIHNGQVGHRDTAQFARDVCIGVAAARGLCKYDRIAPSAPVNPPVVFPVVPIAHCDFDSITSIPRLRGATT